MLYKENKSVKNKEVNILTIRALKIYEPHPK